MSDSAVDTPPAAADAASQHDAAQASTEDRGKVFVRNLDYNITEDSLKDTFSQVGTVLKVDIKSRRSRSLGYAFIQYESPEHADDAVSKFNQTDLNDRTISVEAARPQTDGQSRARGFRGRVRGRGRGGRRGRGRGRGGRSFDSSKSQDDTEGADSATKDGEENNSASNNEDSAAADGEGSSDDKAEHRGRGRGRGGVRGRGRGAGRGRGVRGRGGRFATRKPGPPEGDASETLVFVANIPFDIDDDGLKNVFKDFEFTEAHIVRQERGFNAGKSRGYGFVNLVDTDTQKRALESLNGTEIDGRKIEVRIGVMRPAKEEDGEGDENAESEEVTAENGSAEEKKEEENENKEQ